MAKVRIQARSADIDDAEAEHAPPPRHSKPHHQAGHGHGHVGALTVLERVWRRKGFLGWYQVRMPPPPHSRPSWRAFLLRTTD